MRENDEAGRPDHDVNGTPREVWRPRLRDAKDATIWHAVFGYVKDATASRQCSYVELVRAMATATPGLYPGAIGPAAAMLSYTWGDRCSDVFGALELWCAGTSRAMDSTHIWICSLCVNQVIVLIVLVVLMFCYCIDCIDFIDCIDYFD